MNAMKIQGRTAIPALLLAALLFVSEDAGAAGSSPSTACGGSISYGGVAYGTVAIGSQCWMKQNLNAGNMIGNLEVPDNTAPTSGDPSTVSKWCFNGDPASCTAEGGLYTWAEANALPASCNSSNCAVPTPNQGICPAGWHVPADAELHALEAFLTAPGESCAATRSDWGCYPAGAELKPGGSSGFDAIVTGHHETAGADSFYDKREPSIAFWSALEDPWTEGYAYKRVLYGGTSSSIIDTYKVHRGSYLKTFGHPLRCLADTPVVGPPTSKSECLKGGWKIFNNPSFKNQGDCLSFTN